MCTTYVLDDHLHSFLAGILSLRLLAMVVTISFDVWNALLKLDAMFSTIARAISETMGIDLEDPMLATALTMCRAVETLATYRPKKIVIANVIAANQGIENLKRCTSSIDTPLHLVYRFRAKR